MITGIGGTIVNTTVCEPAVGLVFAALTVTLNVPAAVGVPEIRPDALMLSPPGKPGAVKVVGELVAAIWYGVIAVPTVPLTALPLVMTGMAGKIVNVTGLVPGVGFALVAVTIALNVPIDVGVPVITPVPATTLSPGGKPVALKLVGVLVAAMV